MLVIARYSDRNLFTNMTENERTKDIRRIRLLVGLSIFVAISIIFVNGVRLHWNTIDLDQEFGLRVTIPGATLRWSSHTMHAEVLHCINWCGLGQPINWITFDIGFDQFAPPNKTAARERKNILGQEVIWYQGSASNERESMALVPERRDARIYTTISCADESTLKKMEDVISTLHVWNHSASGYQPREKARSCFMLGDSKGQLDEINKHLASHPNDIEALYDQAFALQQLKKNDEAISTYSKIISLGPQAPYRERAEVYFAAGRYKQCLDDCKRAISIDNKDGQAHSLSSRANERLQQVPAAIEELTKAIDIDSHPIEQLKERARLYRELGKYQLAIDDLTRVHQMWSTGEALEERAKNYELLGKKQEAQEDRDELKYRRAHTVVGVVGGSPRKTLSWNSPGESRDEKTLEKKSPPQDELSVEKVVPTGLSQVEYYHLARSFGGVLPKQCLQCIELAEKMNPKRPIATKAHNLRDTLLPKQMPSDEAIALNFRAYNEISNHDQCRKDSLECIQRFPNYEYGYITIGALEKDMQNDAAAEKYFRKAIEINPHNTAALSRLGDLLRWHNVVEAKKLFQKAIDLDPDDSFNTFSLKLCN